MIDHEGHNLAFILGLPRSGTTLLSVILDRHPQVLCPPEPWIMLALESVGKVCIRHPADSHVLGEAVTEFCRDGAGLAGARAFAAAAYNHKLAASGKSTFVDKTPRYYHILPFLRRTFRDAKWIWLQRNPLDVAASYKTSWRVNLAEVLQNDNGHAAWKFDLVVGLEQLCREVDCDDSRVRTIQYEQLVSSPEETTACIMRFLGLQLAAGQCEFDLAGTGFNSSFAGDKKITATGRPHSQSVGSWRKAFSREELQVLLDYIGAEPFRQLGYTTTLDELRQMGVVDRGPHVTVEHRSKILAAYADRWADVKAAAQDGAPVPWLARLESELVTSNSGLAQARDHERRLLDEASQQRESALRLEQDLTQTRQDLQSSRAHANDLETRVRELNRAVTDLEQQLTDRSETIARLENRWLPRRLYRSFSSFAQRMIVGFPHARRRATNLPLPRISIVTPVYNGESHIREAIESVLSQNYPRLQYIVVDGGSTDRTLEIVNEFKDRIDRIISEKDNGMYDAIGKGFDLASGEILGYLNSDDLLEPGGLLRVGKFFRDHPKAHVVYHEDTVWFDGWRFPNNPQPPRIDRLTMLEGHTLFQDGVFFRRQAYRAVGGLNRQMRRAGDWDLWVRLTGTFPMCRAEPHVSCFRVREGQISGDMASYNAELEFSRAQWYGLMGRKGRMLSLPMHWVRRARNLLWRKLAYRRLFFPLRKTGCFGIHPTPGQAPPYLPDQPHCPLTGRTPDRLLFSSRDTRFGDDLINHIYYSSETHLAITYPPLSKERLNELYEKHYSNRNAGIIDPPPGYQSPYANYRGGRFFDRLILKAVLPRIACRSLTWADTTCQQLLANVGRAARRNRDLTFLDVGCFDGTLLDAIASATGWKTFGLEPNSNAVAIARAAGHEVWQGFAEDCTFVVPDRMMFDVIHLGQTIEHLGDPLTVVRRLRQLLKPGGLMVLSTPNLDSKQIDLFGPTWSHWHPPYHRFLFSRKSLQRTAALADMDMTRCRSYSHPYWTCMSVQLNKLGLGAAVAHTAQFHREIVNRAQSLTLWSKWLWDWRGRGDYLVAVFRKR